MLSGVDISRISTYTRYIVAKEQIKTPGKVIRTDKWTLNPTAEQKALLGETVRVYRRACRYLVGIIYTHWGELGSLTAEQLTPAVEKLMHQTAKRPSVKYPQFKNSFYKFPSYYRRAAISFAAGQVSSFVTRYQNWQRGNRKRKSASLLGLMQKQDVTLLYTKVNAISYTALTK
ncbi:hypothetical protein BJP36_39580 [Moorena producens JHB]|uniref:Transposase n=1 Tax=Moorena producens (strain JHB) TaxID=1454205 RepID=A0A9Q9UWS3_MOOP1|nr:hypothetical protein [Moorena producens]WAN70156.1 hypothetical protein BJP36_39580 [Moorena producens JHB]